MHYREICRSIAIYDFSQEKDEKEFSPLQSFWILLRFSPFCEYFFLLFLLIDVREHLSIFTVLRWLFEINSQLYFFCIVH